MKNDSLPVRVLLYARVSTDEQARHGESVQDQLQALQKWVQGQNCKVVGQYIDEGFSARKSYKTRPALQALLKDVQKKKADAVVFTKLDRWFRNLKDYYKVQEVLDKYGVYWQAILEDYETKTAQGRFKVNIMLSVAEHEADQTSERIKFTFAQKRERGEIISGNMPRGYMLVDKKPVKDPQCEAAVDAFFRSYCAGDGLRGAIDAAYLHGLSLSAATGSFMLRNAAAYAGSIQGVTCPVYISAQERDWILATRKKAPRRSGNIYLFSGIIRCGKCGGRFAAHLNRYKHADGSEGTQIIYNCSRHNQATRGLCPNRVNIYERDVENTLLAALAPALNRLVCSQLKLEAEQQNQKRPDHWAELDRLRRKRSRLKDLYLEELITIEDLKNQKTALDEQITALEISQTPEKKKSAAELKAMLPEDWETIYAHLDAHGKRIFWNKILSEIRIFPDREVVFDIRCYN